jgi:hypothetical protein
MQRSISSRTRAAALAIVALLCAFAPQQARADDGVSVEAGRTAGRAVLIFRDPRGCAIALLRERCIADVAAFLHGRGDASFGTIPKVGPHPASGLSAFVTNGDRDAFDDALSWINNRQASAEQWKIYPREAALYDAGVLDVFLAAAGADEMRQMLGAAPGADLAVHAVEIPAGALPLDIAPLRALKMTRPNALHVLPFARELVSALRRSAPPPVLAEVPTAETPAADAALGLAVATMSELIDAWQWALQSEAQAFAATLADRLDAMVPSSGRPFVVSFRTKVRAGTSFDPAGANDALASAVAVFGAAVARERAQRLALGSAAAQLAYNSAYARAADSSRNLLTVLAGSDVLDAAIPGWRTARADGASIGTSDWLAQHAYALRLVDLIQKANRS